MAVGVFSHWLSNVGVSPQLNASWYKLIKSVQFVVVMVTPIGLNNIG